MNKRDAKVVDLNNPNFEELDNCHVQNQVMDAMLKHPNHDIIFYRGRLRTGWEHRGKPEDEPLIRMVQEAVDNTLDKADFMGRVFVADPSGRIANLVSNHNS